MGSLPASLLALGRIDAKETDTLGADHKGVPVDNARNASHGCACVETNLLNNDDQGEYSQALRAAKVHKRSEQRKNRT